MANTILPILAISAVAYFLIGSVTATPILKAAAAVEGEIYRVYKSDTIIGLSR
jgi:hypothetical protein